MVSGVKVILLMYADNNNTDVVIAFRNFGSSVDDLSRFSGLLNKKSQNKHINTT